MVIIIFVVTLIFGWEEWWTVVTTIFDHTYNLYLAGKEGEEEYYLLSSAVSNVCSAFAPKWNNKDIFKGKGN